MEAGLQIAPLEGDDLPVAGFENHRPPFGRPVAESARNFAVAFRPGGLDGDFQNHGAIGCYGLRLGNHIGHGRIRGLLDADIDVHQSRLRVRQGIAVGLQVRDSRVVPRGGRAVGEHVNESRLGIVARFLKLGRAEQAKGGIKSIGDRPVAGADREVLDPLPRRAARHRRFRRRIGGVQNRDPAGVADIVEKFLSAGLGVVEPGLAAGRVFHARAGIHDQHNRGGLLISEKAESVGKQFRPGESEAQQRDQQHPQREQNKMSQSQLALVGACRSCRNRNAGKIRCFGCWRMMRCSTIGTPTSTKPPSSRGWMNVITDPSVRAPEPASPQPGLPGLTREAGIRPAVYGGFPSAAQFTSPGSLSLTRHKWRA